MSNEAFSPKRKQKVLCPFEFDTDHNGCTVGAVTSKAVISEVESSEFRFRTTTSKIVKSAFGAFDSK